MQDQPTSPRPGTGVLLLVLSSELAVLASPQEPFPHVLLRVGLHNGELSEPADGAIVGAVRAQSFDLLIVLVAPQVRRRQSVRCLLAWLDHHVRERELRLESLPSAEVLATLATPRQDRQKGRSSVLSHPAPALLPPVQDPRLHGVLAPQTDPVTEGHGQTHISNQPDAV